LQFFKIVVTGAKENEGNEQYFKYLFHWSVWFLEYKIYIEADASGGGQLSGFETGNNSCPIYSSGFRIDMGRFGPQVEVTTNNRNGG
jgi:hypothetical protein